MTFWSPEQLATLAHGRWANGNAPANGIGITGVGIDTRTLEPGDIYVAIVGENHDGHDYVDAALEVGASFIVVDDAERFLNTDMSPVLVVPDCVKTLQKWAKTYRDVLGDAGCQVIAVAGSNGKTTTRHLIHHVLTNCGKTGTQSPKSFNNHLGVPLTLLAAQPEHDFVACEVGTNHPGEIAALSKIVRPDIAVITSIGAEHLEFFIDLDGVAKEEAAILPFIKPGGVAFVEQHAAETIAPYYDVQENVAMLPVKAAAYEQYMPAEFPLPGQHNLSNAVLAIAVGRWLGCDDLAMKNALKTASPPEGRMQTLWFGVSRDAAASTDGVTVIHDAYNANPDSMPFALEALENADGRKVAVLADMLELGEHTQAAHVDAQNRAESIADFCWCVGELYEGGQPWSDQLRDRIVASLQPGDTVLLKGSRGMRLERILPAIEKRFGPPSA